jgi:putative CocE/NonD family hydrolase
VSAGPLPVREIENTWIEMPDGVRLAARIWLPASAAQHPVPAIFNYCPYYARLFTRGEDETRYPYYAAHGYACVRVDIRGSGNSSGLPLDEYVAQEQDDGVEIIRWIAAQPWCSGAVGMEGKSWSGINSLQLAARRPPALKAVITNCSTEDRYTDDAHYRGGCVIHDMFNWGTVFLAYQGQAPDPQIVGTEHWRERWLERLGAIDFNLAHWLEHPHRDAFWKHASVSEDYSRIACPVYAIGGWVDGCKNVVFRLISRLTVPRKGLVGPWTHVYPHRAVPGPAIDYLDEALRWWDYWLKGVQTGIMDEPMIRVWMQERSAAPRVASIPGRWVAEDAWPSPRVAQTRYILRNRGEMSESPAPEAALTLSPVQTVGSAGGNWCPSGGGAVKDLDIELPFDQRVDDARSLVFDSIALADAVEILGAPVLTMDVAVDKPVAFVAVRLNEVRPTGESTRITYGILNLCHRDSDETPTELVPGRRYRVSVVLDDVAHRFAAGMRIRVSVSTTYWPMILPAPEPVTLTLFTGASSLTLPVRPQRDEDSLLRPFGAAFVPTMAAQLLDSKPAQHVVEWDALREKQTIRHDVGNGRVLLTEINTQLVGENSMRSEIGEESTDASIEYRYAMGWERDSKRPRVEVYTKVRTTPQTFLLEGTLTAFDGDEVVYRRNWKNTIPRELV